MFILFRAGIAILRTQPRGADDAGLLISAPALFVYDGPGNLVAMVRGDAPEGQAVERKAPFKSAALGHARDVIVHLPPGVERADGAPIVFFFPGYLDRPQHLAPMVVPVVDALVGAGALPPVVVVIPDLSLGGAGEDNPATPDIDERLGSWGVDSNRGLYATYIKEELIPFARAQFGASSDPALTALVGFSAGGFVALNLALKNPDLAHNVAGIAATIDARYSIDGTHLAPYDPARYRPIADDDPNRPVLRAGAMGTFTDEWAYWPVFDSDKTPGPVWQKDRPVWQRVRSENPMDLAAKPGDLSAMRFFLVAGRADNLFFQHHIPRFAELVRERGASVAPDDLVRPGNHSPVFLAAQLPSAFAWIGERFAEEGLRADAQNAVGAETTDNSAEHGEHGEHGEDTEETAG
ncbi:hypothetical protein K8I61_10835 [bacterium]|nr:hypothetical protein [bacterium]